MATHTNLEQDDVDLEQDDVDLVDVLVLGTRMADLKPENLAAGSPAWNACAAYRLITKQPWAAPHYESLAREWADCANALASTASGQERGRDQ